VYQENDLGLYKKHLIKNGITENNEVINYESSIPLEYNIVHMNGGNPYNLSLLIFTFCKNKAKLYLIKYHHSSELF
jgi:hypothetical protein